MNERARSATDGLPSDEAGIGDWKAGASVGVDGCTAPWSLKLGFSPPDLDAAAAMEGGVEALAPADEIEGEIGGGTAEGAAGDGALASATGAGEGALGVSVSLGLGVESGLGMSLMCGKGRKV